MKQIIRLGPGRYIHLDSHATSHETRSGQLIVFILFTLITAVSLGGLIGADITHFNNIQNNGKSFN